MFKEAASDLLVNGERAGGGVLPAPLVEGPLAPCFIFNLIAARLLINTHFRKIKNEDFRLPGIGFGVIEADVTVIRVVVEIDFDVVTADIIAERNVLVLIDVPNRMFKSKLAS